MAKPFSKASQETQTSGSSSSAAAAAVSTKSDERSPPYVSEVMVFLENVGVSYPNVENYSSKDFYSDLLCNHLKVENVRPGRVTCSATVKPAVVNYFGGLHGGAVAAIAERVAIATARTVVGEDKQIFLGELAMSYLSAAPQNAELVVDGSVVRSGRNTTVVAVELKMKKTGKLFYTSRATFFNSPISKL
ncbi:hypothetical protein PTKIN_Ptkin12aG0186800 [Pterospermum kingtungense]